MKTNMAKITIITLGESGVGKTALLNRFRTGKFKEGSRSTFVDHFPKTITVENIVVNIVIWDTAGQERFNSLIKKYYALADGVLLVYDVNDAMTFVKLSRWLSELRKENETAEIIIVGNKNEDPARKQVSDSDVQDFSERENFQHIEASAKTGQNVDLTFQLLTRKILTTKGLLPQPNNQEFAEDSLDSKCSTKSTSIKNEPEISFSYYGQSEQSDIATLTEVNAEEISDEDKPSKTCFQCRLG